MPFGKYIKSLLAPCITEKIQLFSTSISTEFLNKYLLLNKF